MNLRNLGIGLGLAAGYLYLRNRNAPPSARDYVRQQQQQLSPTQQLERQNVMSLIRPRGAVQDRPGATSVDTVVHGTFAHGADWAQPDSSFSRRVRNGRNAVTARLGGQGRVTAAALGAAASAEMARRTQAHSEMHSDRVADFVSQGLGVLESGPGRALMTARRLVNSWTGHTPSMSGNVHLP